MGSLGTASLQATAAHVACALGVETVDVLDNGADGGAAVVAGGGDQPAILKAARELGCTKYVTGTVVHRWARDGLQKGNREFHAMARQWRINLIGASHHNTEKCAVQDVAIYLRQNGLDVAYVEDPVLEGCTLGNWRGQA